MRKRLLSFPELKTEKGIRFTRQHIDRLEKLGKFPMHVKLGVGANGANAWLEQEIDAHIDALAAARDEQAA